MNERNDPALEWKPRRTAPRSRCQERKSPGQPETGRDLWSDLRAQVRLLNLSNQERQVRRVKAQARCRDTMVFNIWGNMFVTGLGRERDWETYQAGDSIEFKAANTG